MRLVGTLGGALLGIWLVGTYDTSPIILLSGIFLIVALATYKFGQYPASQVPYAYYLTGLTVLTVSTYGVPAPGEIWQTGLNRTLETIVGALCALGVTTLIWPRYAREEFFDAARTGLETCGKLLVIEMDAYIHQRKGPQGAEKMQRQFESDLAVVRNLLQIGARESTNFGARIGNYNAFLVALMDLFQSALNLERRREDESHILESLRDELEGLDAAIAEEFAILTQRRPAGVSSPPSQLRTQLGQLDQKIDSMRTALDSVLRTSSTEVVGAFLGHISALRAVCNDLENIRDALQGLPRRGQALPEHKVLWDYLPAIDWFWVKNGIRGGLASVIALVLVQSFNPPGPTVLPLSAWLFTILSRGFLRAGGAGDLGIFQRAFVAALLFMRVLSDPLYAALKPELERLRAGFSGMLESFVDCFREGDTQRDFPSLSDLMAKLADAMRTLRESGALAREDLSDLFRNLEIVNRYRSVADALEECSSIIRTLELHRYVGDYRL